MNLICFPKVEGGSIQAHPLHEQDKLMDLIDQRLNNNVLDDEAQHVINVALLCVQTSATRRPLMSRVLAMLLNWGGYGGCFEKS